MGYSLEEIRRARAYITKNVIDSIFSKKGGANFISLSGKDIEYLFRLYDRIFFQNQISEKISETPGNELKFYASERISGAGGVCALERNKQGCTYYLDIAPNILNTIFKNNGRTKGLPDAAGIGCASRVECLLLIMEHQIIHLLLILWDYFALESAPSKELSEREHEIYGTHGSLFKCMAKEYFGHTPELAQHDLGISSIQVVGEEKTPQILKKAPTFGYAYWSNSCYLDSLMTILLQNVSSFWRMGLMDSDTKKFRYPPGGGVCDIGHGSKIVMNSDVREHALKLQLQIKEDFRSLEKQSTGETLKCSRLRSLLAECLPGMKKGGWVTFSASQVYDVLAGIFPVLLMDVPIQIHRWSIVKNGWIPDPVQYKKIGSFNMWEYLEDPLVTAGKGNDYKEIRWDLLQAPGIAFYNGGTPRIKLFGEKGREKGFNIIAGDRTHSATKYPFDVVKIRSFGKTIIDERYRLVGVISLQGIESTGEGGTHYVARFLGRDHKWYYYNDLSARIVQIEDLPEKGVWKEEGGIMPSMYFYQKTKSR